MLMTREHALSVLNLSEGASAVEIKQKYAEISIYNHPDRKTSSAFTTKVFKEASIAYKRLQQPLEQDWVERFNAVELFSSTFVFCMDPEKGCIIFDSFYPSDLHANDSDDIFDDDEDNYDDFDPDFSVIFCPFCTLQLNTDDPCFGDHQCIKFYYDFYKKFQELEEKADRVAEELLCEEAEAKRKALLKRAKKMRKREKKKQRKATGEKEKSKKETRTIKDEATPKLKCSCSGRREPLKENQVNCEQKSYPIKTNDTLKIVDDKENDCENKNTMLSSRLNCNLSNRNHRLKDYLTYGYNSSDVSNELVGLQTLDIPALSRQLANQGNQLAGNEEYVEAVKLFTRAIAMYDSDHRYYGNRSYCYDRLGEYQKALEDADKAIKINPLWAKGYFRKAKALTGMQRYTEADKAFRKILSLDHDYVDIEDHINALRIAFLVNMGFSKENCENILRECSSLDCALDELLLLSDNSSTVKNAEAIVINSRNQNQDTNEKQQQSFDQPSDNCKSLWIGNITPFISEQALLLYFSKFGKVSYVNILHESRCAFINFFSAEAAQQALSASSTVEISGATLLIRYPQKVIGQNASSQAAADRLECRYWRSSGCVFGSSCRYVHVLEHKGIDLQLVERTPYRSVARI